MINSLGFQGSWHSLASLSRPEARVTPGLSCALGKTGLRHVVTTGAALLHGLPANPQPSALMLVRTDGPDWTDVSYEFYMRDLDRDTRWRREKIAAFPKSRDVLHDKSYGNIPLRWFDSSQMTPVIGARLRNDPEFIISDQSSPVITDQDISSGCEK